MPSVATKAFSNPDEVRTPKSTKVEAVDLGSGVKAARFTMEPGWRWSECIKPVVGTESCQARHIGAVIGGRLHVSHADGSEAEIGAGEAYRIEPGHDAWVIGNEPFVAYEFEATTAESYAQGSG